MSSATETTSATTRFERLRRLLKYSKFAEKEYRHATNEVEVRRGIRAQIRAMREARGLSQEDLGNLIAKVAGGSGLKAQANISRLEGGREGYPRIQTLLQIAEAFDVGLAVRFVPFSDVAEWVGSYSSTAANPDCYDDEITTAARYEQAIAQVQVTPNIHFEESNTEGTVRFKAQRIGQVNMQESGYGRRSGKERRIFGS